MFPLVRSLIAPLLSLIMLISASGLYNTFVSLRLEMQGYANETIGIVVASMYLGILAGSIWLDQWIMRVGHLRALITFSLSVTVFVVAHVWWIDPYYWCILRFFGGICMAGILIVTESWLLMQTIPSMRGAILSVYLGAFYAALSLGQLLIHLSDPVGNVSFYIVSSLSAGSVLPLLLKKIPQPRVQRIVRLTMAQLFKLSPLGFIGGIISGMLLAVMLGLVPVYAKEMGMSISQIGNLMALLIFGGLCFQWPMGRWADKKDRRSVLVIASCLTAFFGTAIALAGPHLVLLLALSFIFGGFAFTIYPLSMGHACEGLSEDQIVPATGGFVLSYGIGSIAGPLIAPVAMDYLGSPGLFYFMSAIALVLVLIGLKKSPSRLNAQPPPNPKNSALPLEAVHKESSSLQNPSTNHDSSCINNNLNSKPENH